MLRADDLHMFFDCPKLQECWLTVEKAVNDIFQLNITMSPTLVLMGLEDRSSQPLSASRRDLLFHMMLLARREICKRWTNPLPPQGFDWLQAVRTIC